MGLCPPETPIRPHSPGAKPALASQRDHSACAKLSSPLLVRKTRDTLSEPAIDIPPPCQSCVKVPERSKSVSRRVLSVGKQGLGRSDVSQRTATCSTISTTELVTDFGTLKLMPISPSSTAYSQFAQTSLSQRSDRRRPMQTPYIDLQITTDVDRVDVNSKQDVWIAISATVRLHTIPEREDGIRDGILPPQVIGSIPSLRLLFQPAPGHRVLQTLGHKSAKEMKAGDSCDLFVRLRIPRYPMASVETESELDVLFADLESTLGTLESEVLYVEARYKHTMMEESNSVLVRRTVKIRRHRPESR